LKVVFVRLLQVLWVLSTLIAVASVIGAFITGEMVNVVAVALVAFLWFIALLVVQYLAFGKLHPLSSFDGSLTKDRYPR